MKRAELQHKLDELSQRRAERHEAELLQSENRLVASTPDAASDLGEQTKQKCETSFRLVS